MGTKLKIGSTVTIVVLAIALLAPFRPNLNLATIALILMLVVVGCALQLGRAAAFTAAAGASLGLNFFFIPPFNTFSITSPEHLIAFAVFVITGLIVAHLSSAAREHQEHAERQRGEAERLYAELQKTVQEKNEREAEVQAQKVKSAFLDAVTHDLRTPLTSIKAAATSLLSERFESEDKVAQTRVREMLAVIVEESDRLNRFIENMIDLARRKSGDSMRTQATTVGELIDAALERASGRLRDRRVELEIAADLPEIFADRETIAEVLYSLLDNAAKYSSTYSRIDVRARRLDNEIEITVEDEGRGIPAELRNKVFEKFARAEGREQGFGLGLAIAKAIMDAHGGRIWIEGRRTGRGVAVHFTLPLKPAALEARTIA